MLAPTGLSVAEEGPAEAWSGFMYLMKKSAAICAPFMSVTVKEPFLCRFYVNRVFGGLFRNFCFVGCFTKDIGTDPYSYWLRKVCTYV
jgi:hypothetical protein